MLFSWNVNVHKILKILKLNPIKYELKIKLLNTPNLDLPYIKSSESIWFNTKELTAKKLENLINLI